MLFVHAMFFFFFFFFILAHPSKSLFLYISAFTIPDLEKKPLQNVVRPQKGALSRVGVITMYCILWSVTIDKITFSNKIC